MDGDDCYNSNCNYFRAAVKKTRYDRTHRSKKSDIKEPEPKVEPITYKSSEEDMDLVSNELLANDDVWFESLFSDFDAESL